MAAEKEVVVVPSEVNVSIHLSPSDTSQASELEEKLFQKLLTEMAKEKDDTEAAKEKDDTEASWDSVTAAADGLTNIGPPVSGTTEALFVPDPPPKTDGNREKSSGPLMLLPVGESTNTNKAVSKLQPIEIIEQNLTHIISKNGGKLHMGLLREEYVAEYGEKALLSHLEAADCPPNTRLTKLLTKMKTLTRGTGSKDKDILYSGYYRPHTTSTNASTPSLSREAKSLLSIEYNLFRLIHGRNGKLLESKASSDYREAYGQRALELSLKDCRCNSLNSAVTKMVRIKLVKENKKAYYVISDSSQPNAKPPGTKSAQQTPPVTNAQTTKSAQQTPPVTNAQTTLTTKSPQQTPPMTIAQTTTTTSGAESSCTYTMIDSFDKLQLWKKQFLTEYLDVEPSKTSQYVAVSCKGAPEALYILAMAFMGEDTFVFDLVKLNVKAALESLRPLFETPSVCKVFHDLHDDVAALSNIGGLETFHGMMDTQLIAEYVQKDLHCDFHGMLDCLEITIPASMRLKQRFMAKAELYARRPITVDVISPVIDSVKVVAASCNKIQARFDKTTWNALVAASVMRAISSTKGGASRRIGFDITRGYSMSSYELLCSVSPENMMIEEPLEVVQDIAPLLGIFPQDIRDALSELDSTHLSDIVLDKGRPPLAWINGKRNMLLAPDRFVQQEEIEGIAERFRFGSDNRAGFERQLHRISAIRNREAVVIGMTVRVGRHVSGNAGIIADLLFNSAGSSILFLGEPGSGKTTIVREVTRILAEQLNVCIVDTSNEIAGDGDIPHPCVGQARRLMVPKLDMQSAVMIEAVQNHTPSIMVIDEIGRRTEVEAAQTCKNRGVRLIASAHGDLRKLVKNQQIRGVVGGLESVTLGDIEAKIEGRKHGEAISKVKTQRAGAPIFEIVIELERGTYDSWRVVMDSGKAVDSILDRQQYEAQRRTRDPETGAIHFSFEKA